MRGGGGGGWLCVCFGVGGGVGVCVCTGWWLINGEMMLIFIICGLHTAMACTFTASQI